MTVKRSFVVILLLTTFVKLSTSHAGIIRANSTNYLSLLRSGLAPGDTLLLEPGTYNDPNDVPGLPIFNIRGEPGRPVVIMGPENGELPVLLGRSTHNTIRFDNASYVVVRNLEIDGQDRGGDGVKAQGVSHHITLENLIIHGVGGDQQIVGISTKAPAWNWTIRRCVIMDAGTGIYLGNSDGTSPFVNGLIEYNVIVNTIGYNMEIKHQIDRPAIEGMPQYGTTIIRHNVFVKGANSSTGGMARPNLLVGHWPRTGPGSRDVYQIYGNLFYQNPSEALFQGEGNIAFHHNLLVNHFGSAIRIQPHNDVPKSIFIFFNTVIAKEYGIYVRGGDPQYEQTAQGNLVFADIPISGVDGQENFARAYGEAPNYLNNPFADLSSLDLFPVPGKLQQGSAIDTTGVSRFIDWDRDFNGRKHEPTLRGAYAGEGSNPGWKPSLTPKSLWIRDTIPPAPARNLRLEQQGNLWKLLWTAPGDDGEGGGAAFRYDIRYADSRPAEDMDSWFATASPLAFVDAAATPGEAESLEVSDLARQKDWFFVMKVGDDASNWSDFSNVAGTGVVSVMDVEMSATVLGNQVELQWTLESGLHVREIALKRRFFAEGWKTLAKWKQRPEHCSWTCIFRDSISVAGTYYYRLEFQLASGEKRTSSEVAVEVGPPAVSRLVQNYPNPFNPTTTIGFSIGAGEKWIAKQVRLVIRDIRGRTVRILLARPLPPGFYEVSWDGRDQNGTPSPSGVYLAVLQIGRHRFARKLVLER